MGVFVGGVLCTRSAAVIGYASSWLGLEPGRKSHLPLGLLMWYHGLWQRQVWYQRKDGARRQLARAPRWASAGTPPSLRPLMHGSRHRPTKRLPGRTLSAALWR